MYHQSVNKYILKPLLNFYDKINMKYWFCFKKYVYLFFLPN